MATVKCRCTIVFIEKLRFVSAILQKKGIYPVGKKMDRVHTKTLEKELDKHPLINEAQCYKTPNGKICVEVTQRVPILHIMSSNQLITVWGEPDEETPTTVGTTILTWEIDDDTTLIVHVDGKNKVASYELK